VLRSLYTSVTKAVVIVNVVYNVPRLLMVTCEQQNLPCEADGRKVVQDTFIDPSECQITVIWI
jgi:hypothetical protein